MPPDGQPPREPGPALPPGHAHLSQPGYPYPAAPFPPAKKENVLGIVGLCCAIAGPVLFVFTLGFLWFVSFPLCVAGLVCGLLGKQQVDRGELPGGRGISLAGFVVGIVGVALHLLAALVIVVVLGLLIGAAGDIDPPDSKQRRQLDEVRSQLSIAPGARLVAS